jgi:hypothetical protein
MGFADEGTQLLKLLKLLKCRHTNDLRLLRRR